MIVIKYIGSKYHDPSGELGAWNTGLSNSLDVNTVWLAWNYNITNEKLSHHAHGIHEKKFIP